MPVRSQGGFTIAAHVPKSLASRLEFKMEDVEHQVGTAIHEHYMAANDHVCTACRWWRQPSFKLRRTRHHFLPQSWRQGSTHAQLLFQSGRQAILLCQARRQVTIAVMLVVPVAHVVAIVIAIVVPVAIVIIPVVLAMPVPFAKRCS